MAFKDLHLIREMFDEYASYAEKQEAALYERHQHTSAQFAEYMVAWRKRNRALCNAYLKQWRALNPDKVKEYRKKWRESRRELLRETARVEKRQREARLREDPIQYALVSEHRNALARARRLRKKLSEKDLHHSTPQQA